MDYLPQLVELFDQIDYKGIVAKIAAKAIEDGVTTIRKSIIGSSVFQIGKKEKYLNDIEIDVTSEKIAQNIIRNISKSDTWSKEVRFQILAEPKNLKRLFVEMDLYVTQVRHRLVHTDEIKKISSRKIGNNLKNNIVIYGGPGAGKTTLMANIFRSQIGSSVRKQFSCPLVIRFREVHYQSNSILRSFGIFDILLQELGISINNLNRLILEDRLIEELKESKQITEERKRLLSITEHYGSELADLLCEFIDKCNFLLIFEGFDEIPSISVKEQVEADLVRLSLLLKSSRFIVTSRNGEFNALLHNCRSYEICPLDDRQMGKFAKKWLIKDTLVQDLLSQIRQSPFNDTAVRPLTLAHLCAIYETRGRIPSKPRFTYDQVLTLLLEKWDIMRGIKGRTTEFENLYIERMKEFLSHIAYQLSFFYKRAIFSTENLEECYKAICIDYGLPKDQAEKVANQIESHTGLLVKVGADSYQFAHKSLQEYLAAKYISNLPTYPEDTIFYTLPQEMAIVISLTSKPNQYIFNFLRLFPLMELRYWTTFTSRLLLEKPDFGENEEAIIFFLNLWTKASNRYTEFSEQYKTFLQLKSNIGEIFLQTNIAIGLNKFLKIYHYVGTKDGVHNFRLGTYNRSSVAGPDGLKFTLLSRLVFDERFLSVGNFGEVAY